MKVYLLTASGVIFLSVVVSLLVPEGKLHKSVTFVMRLICILVLIQPITGLFKSATTDKTDGKLNFDYEYVCEVYSNHQSEQLESLIYKEFEKTTECSVKVSYSDGQFKIESAQIELQENNEKIIEEIYAYLDGLGYINITVYAKSP